MIRAFNTKPKGARHDAAILRNAYSEVPSVARPVETGPP